MSRPLRFNPSATYEVHEHGKAPGAFTLLALLVVLPVAGLPAWWLWHDLGLIVTALVWLALVVVLEWVTAPKARHVVAPQRLEVRAPVGRDYIRSLPRRPALTREVVEDVTR